MKKNENSLFICNFNTDITYNDYLDKKYDDLHQQIVETKWINNMLTEWEEVYFYPMKKWRNIYDEYKDSREMSYLIFQLFYFPEELIILCGNSYFLFKDFYGKRLWDWGKLNICDLNYVINDMKKMLQDESGWIWKDYFIMKYLANAKTWIRTYSTIADVIWKYKKTGSVIDNYTLLFNDIKHIPNIAEEFKNCLLTTKIKDWFPEYMEASSNSSNADFNYWKEILGDFRKIEDNVSDWKSANLVVTKKFKYKNDWLNGGKQ